MVEVELKEGPDLSAPPLHLFPLGLTPLELDLETFWKDQLLIQVRTLLLFLLRFITLYEYFNSCSS
jgi:hypothetical protein